MSEHDQWAYGSYAAAFVLAIAGYFVARKDNDKPRQALQISVILFGVLTFFVDCLPASNALFITKTVLAVVCIFGMTISLVLCGLRGLWTANKENAFSTWHNAFSILLSLAHFGVALSVFGVGFDTE